MYTNILVPLAPDHSGVTENAMRAARALLAPGGRITVLTVVEAIPAYVAQYLPKDQEGQNRRELKDQLDAEFAGHDDVATQVQTGHAAQVILDVAAEGGHDCVVIASHRPGLQDFFLGSTAARVVRHAQCGVHVLR